MKTTLLLIPGMLNDARIWADLLPLVQDEVDVRIASVLGQPSIEAMASDAWALLDDLPPQAPWVLAGFSMGGYVALEMLARPRRLPRGAALLSTSAQPETPESSAAREKTMAAMQADFPKMVEGIIKWGTVDVTPEQAQHLRTMLLDLGLPTGLAHSRAIMTRSDHREALQALALPVQVVCGRQDKVTPLALSEELTRLIPHARLHIMEEAGHMIPCQRAQELAQAIRWLWS